MKIKDNTRVELPRALESREARMMTPAMGAAMKGPYENMGVISFIYASPLFRALGLQNLC